MLKLERATIFVSALLVVLMAVLMNVETLLRYVFGASTRISEEYSGYLFCAATMIGFYPALMQGRFLRITALLSLLPSRVRAIWEVVIALVSAAFCLIVAFECWNLFQTSRAFGSISQEYSATPLMYPQAILPLGFALLAAGMIVRGGWIALELWNGDGEMLERENDVLE
jgi:TRAP-type C4-dicarboxylate transport system permease small subunit